MLAKQLTDQSGLIVLFWCCVGLPVILILPFSALMSIQEERQGNTIELLHLTRLTPWRLVLGKWCSVMDRSLLLLAGVLPYLLVRYFIGGVHVAFELVLLAYIALLASLVTAICLFLSALPHPFLRWGLGLVLLIVVGIPSIALVMYGSDHPDRLFASLEPGLVATVVAGIAVTTLHFLAAAAGFVAPGAISYELVKRVTSLVVIALVALFGHLTEPEFSIVGIFVVVIACFGALTEEPRLNPILFRRSSRSLAGRVAGRLFHPGWPTGILFTLLAFASFHAGVVLATGSRYEEEFLVITLGGAAALLSALATVLSFRPRSEHLAGDCLLHLFVQLGCGIALMMSGRGTIDALPAPLLALLPLAGMLAGVDRGSMCGVMSGWLACVAALSFCVLAARSLPYWRRLRAIEANWSTRAAGESA